jgi:prepilin-type N-terminal cleavage/methylation domain-containing protein
MNDDIINRKNRARQSVAGRRFRGVTLIELMVVIGILGLLAGMSVYALRGAQNDARAARTRGTITKLNDIILQQWEEYRYRAVDLRLESIQPSTIARVPPRVQAHFRVLALRDAMRMEMPDRVTDLLFAPAHYVAPDNSPISGAYLRDRAYPHKFALLQQALQGAIQNSTWSGQISLLPPPASGTESSLIGQEPQALFAGDLAVWQTAVQPSELLYLMVANSTYGGTPALEYFRPSEIGDPDGDGLLEFIDSWGNAIQWIRWPAGYPSDLNRYAGTDAMDPLRTDWRYSSAVWQDANKPQTIVPLIVSGGPDEQFGVTFGFGPVSGPATPIIYARMRQGFNSNRFYIDPFFTWDYQSNVPNGAGAEQPFDASRPEGYRANQLGSIPNLLPDGSSNTFAADNLTNHDIILGY